MFPLTILMCTALSPVNLAQAAVVDPELIKEGGRVDVLPAPFQSCFLLFIQENHVKLNINHSRDFIFLKHV